MEDRQEWKLETLTAGDRGHLQPGVLTRTPSLLRPFIKLQFTPTHQIATTYFVTRCSRQLSGNDMSSEDMTHPRYTEKKPALALLSLVFESRLHRQVHEIGPRSALWFSAQARFMRATQCARIAGNQARDLGFLPVLMREEGLVVARGLHRKKGVDVLIVLDERGGCMHGYLHKKKRHMPPM